MKQFFLLFLLYLPFLGTSQNHHFCGSFESHTASSDDYEKIYFDRFGNSYDIVSSSNENTSSLFTKSSVGHFDLLFANDITQDMQDVCTEVFDDLCTTILRRSNMYGCSNPVDNAPIRIRIRLKDFDNPSILGKASASYDFGYGTRKNALYYAMNGGPLSYLPQEGTILISDLETISWNFDTSPTPPVGAFDFYSIILHEALHMFGFSGNADEDGNPESSFGGYNLWDEYLYFADEFDIEGNPLNLTDIFSNLSPNCTIDDWGLNTTEISSLEWKESVLGNCTEDQDIKIYFGENAVAPIAGNNGNPLGDGSFTNLTSHLNPECGGTDYVMQRSIGVISQNIDGSYNNLRRNITDTEKQILCELGYQVNGDTGFCDGCYVIANPENSTHIQNLDEVPDSDCCLKFYSVCEGESLEILFDDLLCNDFSNGNISLTDINITGVNLSGSSFIESSEGITLSAGTVGEANLTYSLSTDCGCKTSTGNIDVEIMNCIDCSEINSCENIACPNNAENLSGDIHSSHINNIIFGYENSSQNTINICETVENNFIQMSYRNNAGDINGIKEGFVVELTEPILPGCRINFQADALSFRPSEMSVQASQFLPCYVFDALISPDCNTPVDCGEYIFETYCFGEDFSITTLLDNETFCEELDLALFETYTLPSWTNDTGVEINYLIISSRPVGGNIRSSIAVDNIVITTECVESNFTFTTDCYDVLVQAIDPNTDEFAYIWNFGEGPFVNSPIASHTYDSASDHLITLTVIDECGNENISSQMVTLSVPIISEAFNTELSNCEEITVWPANPAGEHTWNFGDNTEIVSNTTITHLYEFPGTYTITHTVEDGVCGNILIETEEINVISCTPPDCCPADAIVIEGNNNVSDLIGNLLLDYSTAQTELQNIYINGTLTLDQSYVFAPGSNVCLGAGAIIAVEVNKSLKATETNFHGCTQMWEGIKLQQGADVYARDCTFQDARAAIQTHSSSGISLVNNVFHKNFIGILHRPGLSNNFFLKFHGNNFNCTGCEEEGLLLPYDGQTDGDEVGTISYAGIVINDNYTKLVSQGNVANGDFINVMENMSNGIIVRNAGVEIEGFRFANITQNGQYPINGFGVFARGNGESLLQKGLGQEAIPTFDDCTTGIFVQNMDADIRLNRMNEVFRGVHVQVAQDRVIEVRENTISTKSTGIGLVQTDLAAKIRIQHNTLTLTEAGNACIHVNEMGLGQGNDAGSGDPLAVIQNNNINLNGEGTGISMNSAKNYSIIANNVIIAPTNPGIGIRVDGCKGLTVLCNEVSGTTTEQQVGLDIISSSHCRFMSNTLSETRTGARFSMVCNSTTLRRNIFESNTRGLWLTPTAVINPQIQEGNEWIGTFEINAAQYDETDPIIVEMSRFEVNSVNPPLFPNPVSPDPSDPSEPGQPAWFIPAPGTTQNAPPCILIQGLVSDTPNELDVELAKETIEVEIYNEEVLWTAKKSLYRKIDDNPAVMADDSDLQAFYATKSAESTGKLTDVDKGSRDIQMTDTSITGQMESLRTLIEQHQVQLKVLESNLSGDPSDEELNNLKIAQSLIYTEIAQNESQLKLLNQSIRSGKEIDSDIIKGENNSISVTENYEINEKTVNEIYLSTLSRGNTDFTTAQISQIWLIASQCPYSGGNAVFKARSLYKIIDSEISFDNHEICNANGIVLSVTPDDNTNAQIDVDKTSDEVNSTSAVGEAEIKDINFSVMPNPASTELIVSYTLSENQSGQISFFDITGRTIFTERTQTGSSSLKLDITSWEAGIYFLEFRSEDGQRIVQKVSVIK